VNRELARNIIKSGHLDEIIKLAEGIREDIITQGLKGKTSEETMYNVGRLDGGLEALSQLISKIKKGAE